MLTLAASSLLLLLLLPLLAHAQSCSRSYTVQSGDICDGISAAQSVSTYQLAVVNYDTIDPNCDNLYPGESLCLGYAGEDCQTTYVVQPNDTCDDIAYANNLNETILYLNNPQIDWGCTNIYVGEVLCIADSVLVPPAPSGTMPATTIPATATPALPWCD